MKMKKLLATALILLMSMMACVPAFAEGWDYTITETIDCTGFTEDKTGSGWEWDHTAKTLKITDNLLIKITPKAGNENYGIKLPAGATLDIQKNLLVGFVAVGENFGTGYGVYSSDAITINGTLRTVREGGDIFAVAAQKVTLGKDAQISAPSCAGVVTPELVVDGNNTIIADYSCIKNNNDNVEITGSGTLTLDCGDKPVDCNGYTVKDSVKLKFIASPVPEERITYTIPASLNSKIQVTHADDEGKMTVSIGEMNSNAWATAIEEALKDSFSGEISSIGFNINKAKLPTGAAQWMHAKGNIISDDQFSEMVLTSDGWDESSSDFFGWNFTLADVTEEGDNYIVTPAKYDDEYIYMAWKDSSGNVIRMEKLNVVVTNSVDQITVPKENVARPVAVGNGQLKFNTNSASHIEASYDENAGLLKYAITDMDAVKAESASKVLKVNTEVSAPDGYDTLTIVDSNGSTQSPDILPATISVPYADNGELATNEYPFKLIWKDSKDSAKELTQILNIRITVKNATWMDEHWTPVSEDQLAFIPNIADIKNNGMPLTLEKGKGDSKVTCIHAGFNKGLTLQNVLDLNQSYVEIKAPDGKNIVGYRQNNSGGNDPEGYVEYNNYTASSQDNIIKAAELNNSTTAQFKFVPFSSFVTPEGITVYYAPKQGYVRLIDWYDKEENIVERQYLYFLMEQADFTVNTKAVAEVNETPSQPTLRDDTASGTGWELACQKNPQEGTNAFYVELKVVDANGEETREIKEHFEKNGSKAEIFLPFFDYGINPEDAKNGRLKFTLTHYKDGIDKAGTEIKYRLDESGTGIWFSTNSFSPFTVKWETVSGGEKPSGSGSGSGSSVWYRGGNSLGASIPSDPTEVLIDGVSVPFTVDGNTITIPSLTDGPHNVKVIWRGGSYSFNITASGTGKSIVALPKTGDSSMGPYVGLCMLVFMGMLAGGAVLNRKKAK